MIELKDKNIKMLLSERITRVSGLTAAVYSVAYAAGGGAMLTSGLMTMILTVTTIYAAL